MRLCAIAAIEVSVGRAWPRSEKRRKRRVRTPSRRASSRGRPPRVAPSLLRTQRLSFSLAVSLSLGRQGTPSKFRAVETARLRATTPHSAPHFNLPLPHPNSSILQPKQRSRGRPFVVLNTLHPRYTQQRVIHEVSADRELHFLSQHSAQ